MTNYEVVHKPCSIQPKGVDYKGSGDIIFIALCLMFMQCNHAAVGSKKY